MLYFIYGSDGLPTTCRWWCEFRHQILDRSDVWFRRYRNFLTLAIWLENACSLPFWVGFWGTCIPPNNVADHPNPKRADLGPNHVIWAIKREYWPHGSSWAFEEEKATGQDRKMSQKAIFHLFGEKPPLNLVSWRLTSLFSTNMAISETNGNSL